jgi:hypothetical protein
MAKRRGGCFLGVAIVAAVALAGAAGVVRERRSARLLFTIPNPRLESFDYCLLPDEDTVAVLKWTRDTRLTVRHRSLSRPTDWQESSIALSRNDGVWPIGGWEGVVAEAHGGRLRRVSLETGADVAPVFSDASAEHASAVRLSPGGTFLAAYFPEFLDIFSTRDGALVRRVPFHDGDRNFVHSRFWLSGADDRVDLIETRAGLWSTISLLDGKQLQSVAIPDETPLGRARTGELILTSILGVKAISPSDGSTRHFGDGMVGLELAPAGDRVVAAIEPSYEGAGAALLDVATGRVLWRVTMPIEDDIYSASFSPSGERVALLVRDRRGEGGRVEVWQLPP